MSVEVKQATLVAHIDDAGGVEPVLAALRRIHGPEYRFAVGRWDGRTTMTPPIAGRVVHRFVLNTDASAVTLAPGEPVRGLNPHRFYKQVEGVCGVTTTRTREALWPGDVLCLDADLREEPVLEGQGIYFEVETEQTAYPLPRLVLLRNLPDRPGGCAAYPGAFRREVLPPVRALGGSDVRSVNRVNEHTLDMRMDRRPGPQPHYHAPVAAGNGVVNQSETALVLPRTVYNLPETGQPGHVVLYRRPDIAPEEVEVVPVRPGSIVVTPATVEWRMGHCFANAFAMLVAIPGFVAPQYFVGPGRAI